MYLFRNSLVDLVVLEVTKFMYVAAIEKADSNRLQKENKGEKNKRKEKKQVASIVMCQSYLIDSNVSHVFHLFTWGCAFLVQCLWKECASIFQISSVCSLTYY